MSPLFGHGDLRLWLLKLLGDRPRHGYDIISGLEEQFLGLYSPSPGTIYPRLSALEDEGLIEVDREHEGRKVFRLTDAGRAELERRSEDLKELGDRLARSAKEIARDIRADVKASVRDLRAEIKRAAVEVRRDERRASRASREAARSAQQAAREASAEIKATWRSLQADLDAFAADVIAAARRHELDRRGLDRLRKALKEAKSSFIETLERGSENKGEQ